MARASGRLRFNADTTSRPLPSPSRKSTTANAGAAFPICAKPSDTLSQEVTEKPRLSIARESRSRNGLSSSTIRSERSAWPVSSEMAFTLRYPCARLQTYGVTTRRCQDRTKLISGILRLQPSSSRVFHDVANTIEDRRIAGADRFAGARNGDPHLDGYAEVAMRSHDFFDQRR